MAMITHYCPRCNKMLFSEAESRYFDARYGCYFTCKYCDLKLIGVDISVCSKCQPEKKSLNKCGVRFFTLVEKG